MSRPRQNYYRDRQSAVIFIIVKSHTPVATPVVPPLSPFRPRHDVPERTRLAAPVSVVTSVGEFELLDGSLLVGRLPECSVCLPDVLVSRMHARISVQDGGVVVEDLHSANGVYVNGRRVAGTLVLCQGDRILLGTTELSLFEVRASSVMKVQQPVAVDQPPCSVPGVPSARAEQIGQVSLKPRPNQAKPAKRPVAEPLQLPTVNTSSAPLERVPSTVRANALKMIGLLAERLAEDGDLVEAVHVMSGQLRRILQGSHAGLTVEADVAGLASHHALQLSRWSGQALWVDYVVELHLSAGLLMSGVTLQNFEVALRRVPSYDRLLFTYYVDALRNRWSDFAPDEQARVTRLATFAG